MDDIQEKQASSWDRLKNLKEKKIPLSDTGKATLATVIGAPLLLEGALHLPGNIGLGVSAGVIVLSFLHGGKAFTAGRWIKEKILEDNNLRLELKEKSFAEVNEEQSIVSSAPRLGENGASSVQQTEASVPLGKNRKNGKEERRTLKQLKSILILGLMEGGKTTTGVHILSHACLQGARLAIIDKHARSEEDSMTSKIRSLESCFDCPIGVDPQTAIQTVQHVRNILDNRIEGAKCDYPLILVVDEFSAIMRQKEDGGKWQECGQILAGLIEDINMEGRKHKVFTVCIGQITNVSRSGGSEIRELFHTRIVHAMKEPQTRMLCLSDYAKDIRSLQKGECLIEMEGCEPFFVKVPYVQAEDVRKIAAQLPKRVVETQILPEIAFAEDNLDIYQKQTETPKTSVPVPEPILPEKGRRAEDIPPQVSIALWNAGFTSRRKLAEALSTTEHQATIVMERDGLK
jgi:hypothetical protein